LVGNVAADQFDTATVEVKVHGAWGFKAIQSLPSILSGISFLARVEAHR
jgi:hypothetical protein